jgi:hypothetical protein
LPLPEAPEVTVRRLELLTAVQVHPTGARTPTLPVDAETVAEELVTKIWNAQVASTVNGALLDVAPPGVVLTTVTLKVPGLAKSAVLIAAVS